MKKTKILSMLCIFALAGCNLNFTGLNDSTNSNTTSSSSNTSSSSTVEISNSMISSNEISNEGVTPIKNMKYKFTSAYASNVSELNDEFISYFDSSMLEFCEDNTFNFVGLKPFENSNMPISYSGYYEDKGDIISIYFEQYTLENDQVVKFEAPMYYDDIEIKDDGLHFLLGGYEENETMFYVTGIYTIIL